MNTRLDISGINMYNITVLKRLWNTMPLAMKTELELDLMDNIDSNLASCAIRR